MTRSKDAIIPGVADMPVICVDQVTYSRIRSYADRIGSSAELLVEKSINEWFEMRGEDNLQNFLQKVYAVSLGKTAEKAVDEPRRRLPSPRKVTCIDAPLSREEKRARKAREPKGTRAYPDSAN